MPSSRALFQFQCAVKEWPAVQVTSGNSHYLQRLSISRTRCPPPSAGFRVVPLSFMCDSTSLPYPTLPHPTLPYPTLPYPTLPYPIFGYPETVGSKPEPWAEDRIPSGLDAVGWAAAAAAGRSGGFGAQQAQTASGPQQGRPSKGLDS